MSRPDPRSYLDSGEPIGIEYLARGFYLIAVEHNILIQSVPKIWVAIRLSRVSVMCNHRNSYHNNNLRPSSLDKKGEHGASIGSPDRVTDAPPSSTRSRKREVARDPAIFPWQFVASRTVNRLDHQHDVTTTADISGIGGGRLDYEYR
jgi:hypothetical protein